LTGNVNWYLIDEVEIGKVHTNLFWTGSISDVMIFDKALDSNERDYLWNDGYGRELEEPTVSACPSADITGDCFVDIEDFTVLSAQWLTGDPCTLSN